MKVLIYCPDISDISSYCSATIELLAQKISYHTCTCTPKEQRNLSYLFIWWTNQDNKGTEIPYVLVAQVATGYVHYTVIFK